MTVRFSSRTPGVVARRQPSRLAIAAGLSLALAPGIALAAGEGGDGDEGGRGSVVSSVTVKGKTNTYKGVIALSKLQGELKDQPQSITVLNKPLLESQGVASLADALRNVPGITIGGAEGGQIGNNINLNGFTARTDIYLDGFRDRGQYYRDTFALEQVEVLMGPSSMLFGRGSTGGAINQVSKKPSEKPFTEVGISGASNGLVRGTADVNAPINDISAFRVAVMGQGGAVSTRDKTTVNDYGVAPSYRWGIGTQTELLVNALVQHNNDRPDYGVSPLNGAPVRSGFDTIYGYSTDRTNQDIVAVGGQVKHKFDGGITVRNQIQYNSVTTDAIETASQGLGAEGAPGTGFIPFTPAGISNLPLKDMFARLQSHDRTIHDTSLFDQIEASGEFNTGPFKNSWLVGGEFGHDDYKNQAYTRTGSCNGKALPAGYVGCVHVLDPAYIASPVGTELPTNLATGKADTVAVYFNDTLALTDRFKLVGGVRFDDYSATITNSINKNNTPGNTTLGRAKQTVTYTSVRAGGIWQPTKEQTYYVSYSTSFDPSLEQLTSTTGITNPLPPETNEAYEVGGKWDVLHNQLDLTAAVFQITQYNSRSQNSDNTYTANGTIRVRGERLGISGKLTPRWLVFGGYTHLDARIISAVAVNTQGKIPVNTPSDTATLWSTYAVTPQWEVGGGATYMSGRFLNNTDLVRVPGYTRLDATLAWHQPRYDIRLNIFNLADAKYYDSLIQSDGGRAVPGAGRTAMISLVFRP
jgi:catecholate siderophore receptor